MINQAIYLAKNCVNIQYIIVSTCIYVYHTLGNKTYTYLLTPQTIIMILKHRICDGKCEV